MIARLISVAVETGNGGCASQRDASKEVSRAIETARPSSAPSGDAIASRVFDQGGRVPSPVIALP